MQKSKFLTVFEYNYMDIAAVTIYNIYNNICATDSYI